MATYTVFIYDGRSSELLHMMEQDMPHMTGHFLREMQGLMMETWTDRSFVFAHIYKDSIPIQAVSMDVHTSFYPETVHTAMFFTSPYSTGKGFGNWHRLRDVILAC